MFWPLAGERDCLITLSSRVPNCTDTSGSSIKLLDAESGQRRKLNVSLPGGARCLLFSPCGCFLLASSARTSREVLIFDVRADATLEPIYVISLKASPIGLDCKSVGGVLEILAVFEKKDACIFQVTAAYAGKDNGSSSGSNGNEESILCLTHVITESCILAGFLGCIGGTGMSGPAGQGATFAVGQSSQPHFVHVNTHDKNTGLCLSEVSINIPERDNNAKEAVSLPVRSAVETTVIGPNETGGKKRPSVVMENGFSDGVSSSPTPSATTSSAVGGAKRKKDGEKPSTDSQEVVEQEPTIAQRLESLSQLLTSVERGSAPLSLRQRPAALPPSSSSSSSSFATSDSLVTLIEQALQAGDDTLLEQCLGCAEKAVVEATARRLPCRRVLPFLRKLVAKFEKRPTRGTLLTQWLSALLRFHTAYLITVPDLSIQLAG